MKLRTQMIFMVSLPLFLPLGLAMILLLYVHFEPSADDQVQRQIDELRSSVARQPGDNKDSYTLPDDPRLKLFLDKTPPRPTNPRFFLFPGTWVETRTGIRLVLGRPGVVPPERKRIAQEIIFSPFLAYFVALAFVVWSFRRFERSMATLITANKKIADGSLDFQIAVRGTEEVRLLGTSLEEMRKKLKEERERRAFLLMGLSHDFRTPIGLIKGYVEAIEDGMAASPEQVSEYLRIVHQKAEQLDRLVTRWLDLVRLETGERPLAFHSVALKDFLSGLVQRFSTDSRLKGRDFSSILQLDPTWTCRMDPELVDRCLENLFSNAIRFTPEGKACGIHAVQEGRTVRLVVWDQGPGVRFEERDLVWEPFFRGRGEQNLGWGLGLSIVKSIVVSHGWTIELGRPETGTSFEITMAALEST